MTNTAHDKAVIAALGGPSALAKRLGFPAVGGVQRVQNWLTRGIPAAVRLEHMALFTEGADKAAAERKPKRKAA
jgi:hypothetical protein